MKERNQLNVEFVFNLMQLIKKSHYGYVFETVTDVLKSLFFIQNSSLEMRHFKTRYFVMTCFHLNCKSWMKLIYDKIIRICCDKNEFNPTCEVQNMENGAFQNKVISGLYTVKKSLL